MGRPKHPLKRAEHRLTERVRALLQLAHAGNLAEASQATGIAYPTLRDLYVGRTVNPRADTLDRLASAYGVSLEWFRAPEEPEEKPALGVKGSLPSPPSSDRARPQLREILIPFAARPFHEVVQRLTVLLAALPPGPGRPIVGEATGEALRFRLCTFLCQPLLAAERAGVEGVILSYDDADGKLDTPAGRAWVRSLSALGRMWQLALGDLLGG